MTSVHIAEDKMNMTNILEESGDMWGETKVMQRFVEWTASRIMISASCNTKYQKCTRK